MPGNSTPVSAAMLCYLVGGAVRDELLGLAVTERDWVVVGETPEAMLKRGFEQVGRDFPVFLHPDSKEEYALARTERKTSPGHTGFEVHADTSVTLEEDLKRRDLTVNAIARSASGELIDPFDGQRDLNSGVLRHVSDAFAEDPLRLFRLARFAAKLPGFVVHEQTRELARSMSAAGATLELPAERVWQECRKALGYGPVERFWTVLEEIDALSPWFVELAGLARPPEALAPDLRFAALGKQLSPAAASALAGRLKTPKDVAALIAAIAQHGDVLSDPAAPVDAIFEALESAGAFRPGARMAQLVEVLQALGAPHARQLGQAAEALAAMGAVDVDSALTGRAIGEAIRARRRQRLAELLEPRQPG